MEAARGPVRLAATTLRTWVLSRQKNPTATDTPSQSPPIPKTFQIVDVRDDDYVGGHIPATLNVPSRQFSSRVDELVDELKDNEAIVFTCALSQQRGPNAAQKYYNRIKGAGNIDQKVYVLTDGFYGWQARFGKDKMLTEDWAPDVWEYYM